jgi:hypothetical protein
VPPERGPEAEAPAPAEAAAPDRAGTAVSERAPSGPNATVSGESTTGQVPLVVRGLVPSNVRWEYFA